MSRTLETSDLYAISVPSRPALSPDGSRVVYVLTRPDRESDANERTLWSVPTAGGAPTRITTGDADSAPCFAPDGGLAFLREVDEVSQLFVLVGDGEPRQLTSLPDGVGQPSFSPDGRRIAFTAPVRRTGAERTAPQVSDRVNFKKDGLGHLGDRRHHLFVIDADGANLRQLTDGDFHAGSPSFSADGARLAFTASMGADADLDFESSAYVLPLDGAGSEPQRMGQARFVDSGAIFLGDRLLAIGCAAPAVENGHLLLLGGDGPDEDLTASLDRNLMPGSLAYPGGAPTIAAGGRILFVVRDRGFSHLYSMESDGSDRRPLIAGAQRVVAGLSARPDLGIAAVIVADPERFGEVATVDIASGELRILTSHTRDALPDVSLFAPEPRSFDISDGVTVHGWIIRDPAQTAPGPLLLDVHGGPHNAWSGVADATHLYHQVLVSRGWSILTINPRGSDGYGQPFLSGVDGAWGEADEHDFIEPIDELIAEGIADPARLAIAGYSYGGFMTCYLTGKTTRFASAVAGGLICDLAQMDGTSDTGLELAAIELGLNDAARDQLSPLRRISAVTTPTLILHGASDHRCPVDQAERWFAGLRMRGVPTRMVLYPGGSHLFFMQGRPSHRADYNDRIVDWVETYR